MRYRRDGVPTRHDRHDLLLYDTDDDFAVQVERYVIAGLDAGDEVSVIVGARKQMIVREMLGRDAAGVSFVDPGAIYTRPEAALANFDATVRPRLQPSDPCIRVYGELPAWGTRAESDAWIRYEAVANRAFSERCAILMCGYDARTAPADVLAQMRGTHSVVHDGCWHVSPEYEEPEDVVRRLTPTFEAVSGLRELAIEGERALQDRLADELSLTSVSEPRVRDMLVAAREVLANAERHGNGVRAVRVGRVGEHIVCEVQDAGAGLDDPLAGYLPPRPLAEDRAGLWIARQLTSRLELHSAPNGLTVRLWG